MANGIFPENEYKKAAFDFLRAVKKETDPATTRKSFIVEGSSDVTMYTPDHIQFAKYGRAAGRKPPFTPIFEWVQRKNIGNQWGMTNQQAAWAIVNKIGNEGTNNYVASAYAPGVPTFLEQKLADNYPEYLVNIGRITLTAMSEYVKNTEILPSNFKDFKL